MSSFSVAIAADFFAAFARLPKNIQNKVQNFVFKFLKNPRAASINYEKISSFRDKNLRSVRIDRAYRGIVLHPGQDNVYILLWVDHHDKAYRWAENKVARIHPETGAIQVMEIQKGSEVQGSSVTDQEPVNGLFSNLRDRQLIRLGIPPEQLSMVRHVITEEDLDRIESKLPAEAAEALYMLAAGYDYEQTLRELERTDTETRVDTSDFATALTNLDSKRRFMVVEDELELQAMFNAPLEKWRVFLHPTQRSLVERDWNGPVRVLGGAGTGKTVVAMHRAKWLAGRLPKDGFNRILFTTFTRNLAADLKENLEKICSAEELRRIDVINLDKWVSDFLKGQGYNYTIDYGQRTKELWEQALSLAPTELNLPEIFYRKEWEEIIQPQEIRSLKAYLKASRTGRGVRLNRKARKAIWPVFEEYQVLLDEHRLREADDAMRDARIILEKKGNILPYSSIIVDEAQDMGAQAFKLLRQMVPEGKNDLFIVGDAHQRIYRHRVVLGRCGINIMGRGRRLKINYRTTEENRKWAVALLKGVKVDDLDGGTDDQKGYKSLLHGVEPMIRGFSSFNEETEFIIQFLKDLQEKDAALLRDTCLVARTNKLVEEYKNAISAFGIQCYLIRRSQPEDRNRPGLRIATMHRVKGLEFDRVIIAGVKKGVVPLETSGITWESELERKEIETKERALLYVAATRAKKEVLITYFGEKSSFIE